MKQNKRKLDLGPKRWFRRNKRKKQSMAARMARMMNDLVDSVVLRKGLPKHVIEITVWETCHRSSEYSDCSDSPFSHSHEFSQQDYALETMWVEYVERCVNWERNPEACMSEFDFKTELIRLGEVEHGDQPDLGIFSLGEKTYYVDTKTRALYRFADILGQSHVYHRPCVHDPSHADLRKKGKDFGSLDQVPYPVLNRMRSDVLASVTRYMES